MNKLSVKQIPFFLKVIVFLALYIFGLFYLAPFLRRQITAFIAPDVFHPLLLENYGKLVGRLIPFLWCFLIYFLVERLAFQKKIKKTIFFQSQYPQKRFFQGVCLGGGLILSMIGLSMATGSIIITSLTWNPSVLVLYFFSMILTASSEELALRGFTLHHLSKGVGSHSAVFISAILFGLLHLPSLAYAFAALLAGIALGYAFLSYGIYYVIGWHFAWNWIETAFFSAKIVQYKLNNAWLVGERLQSPDQMGFLAYPVLAVAAIFYFLIFQNRKQRS